MVLSKVKDVFSSKFESVNQKDTLSVCLSLFEEGLPAVLMVLNEKGKYVGVIARRWIVRSRVNPTTTKVETLMRPAPRTSLQDSLSKAAKLMINSGIMQLPVYRDEKLVGIVTDEHVIHGAVIGNWGNTKVEEIMTKNPFTVKQDDSVGTVVSLFRQHGISHTPVVIDNKLVGMIGVQDLIHNIFQPKQSQTVGDLAGEKAPVLSIPVKGIMTKPAITVLPGTTLKDAEKKMHKFNISSLVVAEKGRPVGILTKKDFLEPLAAMEKPSRAITIQFSVKDVGINEIKHGLIMDDFESFARRYGNTIRLGTLFVYMKGHGTNFKGDQLIHCRLKFRARKNTFFSSSEGYGVEQTFRIALDRIEKQLLRSQELAHEPKYIKRYLKQIDFPSTEL
jgi:predicted transcriptional regulator